jgi:hypothetical protein
MYTYKFTLTGHGVYLLVSITAQDHDAALAEARRKYPSWEIASYYGIAPIKCQSTNNTSNG